MFNTLVSHDSKKIAGLEGSLVKKTAWKAQGSGFVAQHNTYIHTKTTKIIL